MPRELIWRENTSFAAWGCTDCNWVLPSSPPASDKPPADAQAAFDGHTCTKTRYVPMGAKK
jgi:hypothetical protein